MPKQAPPADPPEAEKPDDPRTDAPPRQHANRFFLWVRSLGLVRQPGWIGGVCAGIADRLGIDVVIVRGILVVIAVLGGPAVLLYALAWLVLPDNHGRIHLEDLIRGKVDSAVAAIAILVALSLLPVAQGFWWFGSLYWGAPQWGDSVGRAIWTIIILGLLVWFVVWFSRRTQRSSTTASPATTDDRPETIPTPTVPATAAPSATAPSATIAAPTIPIPAPEAPAPLAAGASTDEVAAWRESQAQWKSENQAFRQQQAAERQSASQTAALAARTERVARALEYREERARTRSNPLYSVALIGIGLIGGAITTLVLGGGAPSPMQFLGGAAVAVGILGLGIILNGALGRRSGGASAIAVLLCVPLALAALFPQTDVLRYAGPTTLSYHASQTDSDRYYVQLTGNTTVNLADYYSTPRPTTPGLQSYNRLSVWVGSGNVTVIVPADEFEYLSAKTGSGTVTGVDHSQYRGQWSTQLHPAGAKDLTDPSREIDVSVYAGSGNITFVQAQTTTGAIQ
jgi:phage shock protein PspC (stress-responsive transcriptional regulator)